MEIWQIKECMPNCCHSEVKPMDGKINSKCIFFGRQDAFLKFGMEGGELT